MNKRVNKVVVLMFLVLFVISGCENNVSVNTPKFSSSVSPGEVQAIFCPSVECENSLIRLIDGAETEVLVMIYSFTLGGIKDALIRAKERGVKVRIIMDKQQAGNQYAVDEELEAQKIELLRDTNSRLMHNKVAIIDKKIVVTGSFNWSTNARDYNDENIIIIHDEIIATAYKNRFEKLWIRDNMREVA